MTGLKGASAATCQNSLATQRPNNGHIDRIWTPFSASFFIKSQNFHWIIRHSHHWAFFFPNILSLRIGLADIQDLSVLSWKTLWKSFESARGKLKYCEVKSQSWSKGRIRTQSFNSWPNMLASAPHIYQMCCNTGLVMAQICKWRMPFTDTPGGRVDQEDYYNAFPPWILSETQSLLLHHPLLNHLLEGLSTT